MSTNKPTSESNAADWLTFEKVYQSLVKLIESTPTHQRFPPKKLRNRLINVGLKELLDGVESDRAGIGRSDHESENRHPPRALEVYGFPFKFTSQWDEATLALGHFLNRFREEENSKLEVSALHLLSKGEDKTLSDWQSAKAKLYLELQNMILLLNGVGGRKSRIRRVFAFSKIADIAFLTQSAVSLLNEQIAAGIGIGFLFTDKFDSKDLRVPISNGLIVSFTPDPKKPADHKHHFYIMYELLDAEKKGHDLPYQERCATRWFWNSGEAFRYKWIQQISNLFPETDWDKPTSQWSKWEPIDYSSPTEVYGFDPSEDPEKQIFNSAVVMMAKAFEKHGGAEIEAFKRRINNTITSDWIRLQRAISAFDDPSSYDIEAVDATSVKNSLTIHESDPTYRHWLRTSLSRVLRSSDDSSGKLKSLNRIYILDDTPQKGAVEFRTFRREMQYYLDYFHYEISEMRPVETIEMREEHDRTPGNSGSLDKNWENLEQRVKVFVTTTTILRDFAIDRVNKKILDELKFDESKSHPLLNVDFISSRGVTPEQKPQGMIYNFLNQRADPGELEFKAFLFRKPFDDVQEEKILFRYLERLRPTGLYDSQREFRISRLAESVCDYQRYDRALDLQISKYSEREEVRRIREIIDDDTPKKVASLVELGPGKLLGIRKEYEQALYQYFEKKFSYIYCFLRHYSLEVKFFGNQSIRKIEDIAPFNQCIDVQALTDRMRVEIGKRDEPVTFEEIEGGGKCHELQKF